MGTCLHQDAFVFVLKKTSPSENDLIRIDNFFTKYGYNVDGYKLDSITQLNCRNKFTYIQGIDIKITSLKSTDITRTNDTYTANYIKQRFLNGLRIWNSTPDFNYSTIDNSIREV